MAPGRKPQEKSTRVACLEEYLGEELEKEQAGGLCAEPECFWDYYEGGHYEGEEKVQQLWAQREGAMLTNRQKKRQSRKKTFETCPVTPKRTS